MTSWDDDPWHDYREECREEARRAPIDAPDCPDDRDLHELFPDTPPHDRRRPASDHARNYR